MEALEPAGPVVATLILIITAAPTNIGWRDRTAGLGAARWRSIAGDPPVWAYHVPAVSAPGVPTDVAAQLDVAAMKDSSGDADRLAAEAIAFSRPLYVGSPTVLTLARALGLPGAILALGNTVPELCLAAFGGDLKAQAEVARLHIQSLAGFPAGLKQTIRDTYRTSAATRPRLR